MIAMMLSLILLLPTATTPQPPSPGPSGTEQVVLIVRDGAGNGLAGITIDIAVMGPPDEPYGNCTTDRSGECLFRLPVSDYMLAFRDWQGQPFGAASSQNQGPVEEAGELIGEGFGLHIEPLGVPQTFLFVIARDTNGGLVALWDNARSRDQDPDPYIAPQQQGLLTLGPLAAGPAITATPQLVITGYDPTVEPATTPTLIPAREAPQEATLGGLFGLLLCFGASAGAAGVWWLSRRHHHSRVGTRRKL